MKNGNLQVNSNDTNKLWYNPQNCWNSISIVYVCMEPKWTNRINVCGDLDGLKTKHLIGKRECTNLHNCMLKEGIQMTCYVVL